MDSVLAANVKSSSASHSNLQEYCIYLYQTHAKDLVCLCYFGCGPSQLARLETMYLSWTRHKSVK